MYMIDVIIIGRTGKGEYIVKRIDTNEAYIVDGWNIYNNRNPIKYVYEKHLNKPA